MKLLLVVLTVSLLSFIETKSVEDNTRKCIVKYLSDKQLLDSSFDVDSVLPDNCYELIDNKVHDIYETSYYKDIADVAKNIEIDIILQRTDMVDLILKSNLISDTRKANELIKVVKEIIKIEDFFESYNDNTTESFKFTTTNRVMVSPCLQSYLSEMLDSNETMTIGCKDTFYSFKKSFETEFLQMLPKLSSAKGQICIRRAYTQLNMTDNFFNGYIYKMMEDESIKNEIVFDIGQFYQPIYECVRLITKETPNNGFFVSLDFNVTSNTSLPEDESVEFRNTHGLNVKFNHDRSNFQFHIIANKTSEAMVYSKCFLNELNHFDFKSIASKVKSVEDDFDVVKLLRIKDYLKAIFEQSLYFCNPSYFDGTSSKIEKDPDQMKCFRQFITKDEVEGETTYKINITLKPDDVKCNKYFVNEKYEYNDVNDSCVFSKFKKNNYYKKMWTIQIMDQLNISIKQQKQLEHDVIQFERLWKDILIGCRFEEFNEEFEMY